MTPLFKWFGLQEYDLKLFLIKGRFFLTGDGLEKSQNKLMALGFREVPVNPDKPSKHVYWSAKSGPDFMQRIAAAFPLHTVEMMPPEAINPTIKVNKTQNLKGDKNEKQQRRKPDSNAGKPVVEPADRDLHATPDGGDAVLVGSSSPDDSGSESSANDGIGVGGGRERGDDIPRVAGGSPEELRGGGSELSREVEASEPSGGDGYLSGAGGLDESGQNVEQGSGDERVSGEPANNRLSDPDDEPVSRLSDSDVELISSAFDDRERIVSGRAEAVSNLAELVTDSIEGDEPYDADLLKARYDALHATRLTTLFDVFYANLNSGNIFDVVSSLSANNRVRDVRAALTGAGYGWMADDIKPMFGSVGDVNNSLIDSDTVKRIVVAKLEEEAASIGVIENNFYLDDLELRSEHSLSKVLEGIKTLEGKSQETAVQSSLSSYDVESIKAAISDFNSSYASVAAAASSLARDANARLFGEFVSPESARVSVEEFEQREVEILGMISSPVSLSQSYMKVAGSADGLGRVLAGLGGGSTANLVSTVEAALLEAGYGWIDVKSNVGSDYVSAEIVEHIAVRALFQRAISDGVLDSEITYIEDLINDAGGYSDRDAAYLNKFIDDYRESVAGIEDSIAEYIADLEASERDAAFYEPRMGNAGADKVALADAIADYSAEYESISSETKSIYDDSFSLMTSSIDDVQETRLAVTDLNSRVKAISSRLAEPTTLAKSFIKVAGRDEGLGRLLYELKAGSTEYDSITANSMLSRAGYGFIDLSSLGNSISVHSIESFAVRALVGRAIADGQIEQSTANIKDITLDIGSSVDPRSEEMSAMLYTLESSKELLVSVEKRVEQYQDESATVGTLGDAPDEAPEMVVEPDLEPAPASAENEVLPRSGDAEVNIYARLTAAGYPIADMSKFMPFAGVSAELRELLASTRVILTDRDLYSGFAQMPEGTPQTLVMNAPRPIMGSSEIEGDFFEGRSYALIDTNSEQAVFQVTNNVRNDATLPVYIDTNTLAALAIYDSRYAADHVEMLETGSANTTIATLARRAVNTPYTIKSLEAKLADFSQYIDSAKALSVDGDATLSQEDSDSDEAVDAPAPQDNSIIGESQEERGKSAGGQESAGSDSPKAFADDVDEREWSGLTLDDLKSAEAYDGNIGFRVGLNAVIMAEDGTPFSDMSARSKIALLQFTGWGGIYDDYRIDKRSNYSGVNASEALDMSQHEFQSAIMENRLESYYTPSNVIESIWKAVKKAGVPASGKYLEPAVGAGHFFVGAPADVQSSGTLVGIDCDPIAVRIAKVLAPDAKIIESRYENVVLDNSFDAVIGNVPFGSTRVSDLRYPSPLLIHDYFIKRSLAHLKDGGLMAVVTTAGTMNKTDSTIRSDIMETADLVAAVRLPSEVFARDNARVVTDVLVFQKRPAGTEPSFDFTSTELVDVEGNDFRVNSFFVNNPQFVLGDTVQVSGQFGPKMDVTGDLDSLGERLDAALSAQVDGPIFNRADWVKAKNVKPKADDSPEWDESAFVVDNDLIAGRMIGEYLVVDEKLVEVVGTKALYGDDGVYLGDESLVSAVDMPDARKEIVMDFVELRDAALSLMAAQLNGSDDELVGAQEVAMTHYNAFVEKHGSVNLRKNTLAFGSDPRASEVMALEVFDDDDMVVVALAGTLSSRIVGAAPSVEINTSEDAYYVSIDKKGVIDFDYMSEISGIDAEQIKDDLLGRNVFIDPKTSEFVQADVYLSGNVVQKLREAEQAAEDDPVGFSSNVAALNEVRPMMLPFEDISISLGSSWIPSGEIREFFANACGEDSLDGRELSIDYDEEAGDWKVTALASFEKSNDVVMRSTFGTEKIKFTRLLEMALNGQRPSHTKKDYDGKSIPDHEATAASRAKQDEIKEAFVKWVGATDERKEKYADMYHEKINVIALPKIDGSRITFEGMAASWKPRPHQADVVAAALRGYNTMAAHPVGSGKTFEMVATAIKLKQVGMCTKPMIAVPNHMLGQMAREAKEIFPSAKILMVTNEDLKKENRKRFFAVARNNDWDLVVCTHSMLNRIKAPFEIQLRAVEDKIVQARRNLEKAEKASIKAAAAKKLSEAVSAKDAMVKKHEESLSDPDKAPMMIEDIGVDTLLVDEMQQYKNLDPETRMQVLGLRASGSMRATNLLELSMYFRELHGKCAGLHGYTGTPVANSMSELYTHMRYLRPDILEGMGMNTFDQWAQNFCEVVSRAEVLADGGTVAMRDRLSKFKNLPELIKLFRSFADVRSHAELNLPTPELTSKLVVVPQTELEKAHMTHLAIRAIATRQSGADKTVDNILNIATDGRKAALDMRMVDSRLPDDASLKLTMVAENVMREWNASHEQKGTQLVFMDIGTPPSGDDADSKFSGYGKLREKLVEQGMPLDQIAFIHDANTDAKKEALFKKVRSGQIRVLIGSTEKMGVGTNVQERLCALHNVDCPWRPDQLEQRIGRIMRQGNLFFDKVTEYKYVRKDSLENFMWQGLNTKKAFISQAMGSPDKASREYEEEINAGYGDVLAAATGEPRIREKFEIDADVQKLERQQKNWATGQAFSRDALARMRKEIVTLTSRADIYKGVHAALPNASYKAITVEGSVYGVQEGSTTWLSATDAGNAIKGRFDNITGRMGRMNEKSNPLNVKVGGIELVAEMNARGQVGIKADLDGRSVPDFAIYETKNPRSLGTAIRTLYNAAGRVRDYQDEKVAVEKSISRIPAAEPFWPDQHKLDEKMGQKRELDKWFIDQDFDKRFEGIVDPFIPILEQYIAEHEAKLAMEVNASHADEIESFSKHDQGDPSLMSDQDDLLGGLDDDLDYEVEQSQTQNEKDVPVSKGMSMG